MVQLFDPSYVSCYFDMPTMMAWSLGELGKPDSARRMVDLNCKSNRVCFQVAQIVSLSLNTCLCVDIVLQLWFPFKDKESRVKKYYAFTVFMTVITTVYYGMKANRQG